MRKYSIMFFILSSYLFGFSNDSTDFRDGVVGEYRYKSIESVTQKDALVKAGKVEGKLVVTKSDNDLNCMVFTAYKGDSVVNSYLVCLVKESEGSYALMIREHTSPQRTDYVQKGMGEFYLSAEFFDGTFNMATSRLLFSVLTTVVSDESTQSRTYFCQKA